MDIRDTVIAEIRTAPDALVAEVLDFVRFLKSKPTDAAQEHRPRVIPDFEARRREIFGDRILPDSQAILDELRADRL